MATITRERIPQAMRKVAAVAMERATEIERSGVI